MRAATVVNVFTGILLALHLSLSMTSSAVDLIQACVTKEIELATEINNANRYKEELPFKVHPIPNRYSIELYNTISTMNITNVYILEKCVKLFAPKHVHNRVFLNEKKPNQTYGGNNVTFIGGFFQTFFTELTTQIRSKVQLAVKSMHWQGIKDMGIRCVEVLRYEVGGELKYHKDNDSVYTIAIMLTDRDSYIGGKFSIGNI